MATDLPPRLFRAADPRSRLARARRLGYQLRFLLSLPGPVRAFWVRALVAALRRGDGWSVAVACRPAELHRILEAFRGCASVGELGTAAAWTTSALALAEPGRRVLSWDVEVHPQRERTLALLPPEVRARIELHERPGGRGPEPAPALQALFLDSSHEREETAASFRLFSGAMAPGGIVAFHDFADPDYPGVMEAIDELGITGRAAGHLFVWRKP